ncbi:MAG: DUF7134 domain-containing protein, partial [Chloroflexota bacterium]
MTIKCILDENHHGLYGESMATDMRGWRTGRRRLARFGQWLRPRPLVADSLLAGAVAGPLAIWSLYTLFAKPPWPLAPWLAVVVGLAVIAGPVALAFRQVAPPASFVAVSAASLVQTAVPGAPALPPSLIIFPLSLFAFCAYGRRPAPAAGLAVCVAGAGVITAQLALNGQAKGALLI